MYLNIFKYISFTKLTKTLILQFTYPLHMSLFSLAPLVDSKRPTKSLLVPSAISKLAEFAISFNQFTSKLLASCKLLRRARSAVSISKVRVPLPIQIVEASSSRLQQLSLSAISHKLDTGNFFKFVCTLKVHEKHGESLKSSLLE